MFENRADYIANAMGPKLMARAKQDRSFNYANVRRGAIQAEKIASQHGEQSDEYKAQVLQVAKHVLEKLAKADPTKNFQYLQWIAKRWVDGDFAEEDLDRVKGELEDFEKFKPRLKRDQKDIDINKYKSAAEVFGLVQGYRDAGEAHSKKEEGRREEEKMFKDQGAELFYKGDKIKIVIPKTQSAACHFGKGTRWCTAATQSWNAFKSYADQGPLYVIMTPTGKYQFHFPTSQFMNELDQPVKLSDVIKKYPELKDAFHDVAEKIGFLLLLKKVTPEAFYNALQKSMNMEKKGHNIDNHNLSPNELLTTVDASAQDERIAELAAKYSPSLALKTIRPDLQQTPTFQRAVILKRPELFQSLDPKMQDADLVKQILAASPTMLRYVRPDLMAKNVLIDTVSKTPQVLGQIPASKQDMDVISAAFKSTPNMNIKRTLISMVHDKSIQTQLHNALRKAS